MPWLSVKSRSPIKARRAESKAGSSRTSNMPQRDWVGGGGKRGAQRALWAGSSAVSNCSAWRAAFPNAGIYYSESNGWSDTFGLSSPFPGLSGLILPELPPGSGPEKITQKGSQSGVDFWVSAGEKSRRVKKKNPVLPQATKQIQWGIPPPIRPFLWDTSATQTLMGPGPRS